MSAPVAHEAVHQTALISATALHYVKQLDWMGSLSATLPELILALTAVAVVIVDLFLRRENSYWNGVVALAGTGFALLFAIADGLGGRHGVFVGSYVADGLSHFFRGLFIVALLLTILIASLSKEIDRYRQGEFYAVLITAALGMCLVASAGNLVSFVLAFETMSLMSYVLVAHSKGTRFASEASLKYLLFGGLSSGIMIFGLSYFYGLSGTMNLPDVTVRAFAGGHTFAAFVALMLVLVGIGFKISMVPFHTWTPDVYQGAPLCVGAFLSTASKAAGFAALVRLVWPLAGMDAVSNFTRPGAAAIHVDFAYLFGVLAIVTMTLGNLVALRQRDFKRLLAYSSIAHAGYMLLAFANMNDATLRGLLSYLVVYLFMNMGLFFIVQMLENERGTTEIAAYRGYWKNNKLYVGAMVLILFSLIGLPPAAGLLAKVQLFYGVVSLPGGAISPWLWMLIIIGVLNSVVSLYYYILPAKIMIIDSEEEGTDWAFPQLGLLQWTYAFLLLFATTAPLLYLFFKWNFVNGIVGGALGALAY